VEENGMVFNAPLNMLADDQDDHSNHFDFEVNIKQEEDDNRPLSPTSLNDDMEIISSPGASNSSSSSAGSILDQLANGSNNNANNHAVPHQHVGYWNYAQHATRVVNPMMHAYAMPVQQSYGMYPTNMFVPTEMMSYAPQPVGYTYVENAFPVAHLVPMPQFMSPFPQHAPMPQQHQRQERKSPDVIDDDEDPLEMKDEEF